MEQEEIIEKLRRYMEEKLELSFESCYFITKSLNEQYWDEIQNEDTEDDSEEEDTEDEFAEFDDNDSEEKDIVKTKKQTKEERDEDEEEIDFDEPSSIIKKPRVKVKE